MLKQTVNMLNKLLIVQTYWRFVWTYW